MIAAALIAALACGFARTAEAAGRRVRVEEGRGSPAPAVARYAIDEGGDFVLDREARQALVKFSDSQEIWVLSPFRGPRGDIIYKNDVDEPMLRATKLGGMTVFTVRRPEGAAAALIGPGIPIRLPSLGPVVLYQRLYQASVRTSRAAQHLVGFDAPDADPKFRRPDRRYRPDRGRGDVGPGRAARRPRDPRPPGQYRDFTGEPYGGGASRPGGGDHHQPGRGIGRPTVFRADSTGARRPPPEGGSRLW